ncbi:MAG: Uma2 family endonuclease, partial [candidate division NC10 bacterium]
MASLRIRTRRWTRQEYDRLIEIGLLQEDDPIELIEGRLVVAEPQHDPHARAVELVAEALRLALGRGWRIRVQLPLALGPDSEPEPDVSVVRGTPRDAPSGHPTTAALVVEVADSGLRLDRGPKARVYARAGIADYWIVNLIDRVRKCTGSPVDLGRAASRRTPLSTRSTRTPSSRPWRPRRHGSPLPTSCRRPQRPAGISSTN